MQTTILLSIESFSIKEIRVGFDGEERAGCFTLFVFLMSFDGYRSLVLPHGAVGWCAVCLCGIS